MRQCTAKNKNTDNIPGNSSSILMSTYFVIHFDARDRCSETEFSSITIAARISVRLDGVHIGRRQNSFIIIHMVQHELPNAPRIRIVVIDTIPQANVTIAASCDHIPVCDEGNSWNSTKCCIAFQSDEKMGNLLAIICVATMGMASCVRISQARSFE